MLARGSKDDDKRKRLLERCLKQLKELFLVNKDMRPRKLNDLLKETYNMDAYDTDKVWLGKVGLPGLDRVAVTRDGRFLYKPPLPCRDAPSLLALLIKYKHSCTGMVRQEVLDSIPGRDKAVDAINSLRHRLNFLGSESDEKLQVLMLKDDPKLPEVRPIWGQLWRSIDLSQIDKLHIEAQLEQDGVKVEKRKFKRPGFISRRTTPLDPGVGVGDDKEVAQVQVRHIRMNAHVQDHLLDYMGRFKRKPRQPLQNSASSSKIAKGGEGL